MKKFENHSIEELAQLKESEKIKYEVKEEITDENIKQVILHENFIARDKMIFFLTLIGGFILLGLIALKVLPNIQ